MIPILQMGRAKFRELHTLPEPTQLVGNLAPKLTPTSIPKTGPIAQRSLKKLQGGGAVRFGFEG